MSGPPVDPWVCPDCGHGVNDLRSTASLGEALRHYLLVDAWLTEQAIDPPTEGRRA